ncbi:MAG: hypothetical protein V1799_01760 [bacterium]
MKTNGSQRNVALYIYLSLAVLFACLSIPASKLTGLTIQRMHMVYHVNLGWMFWILIVLSILCLLPPIHEMLKKLAKQESLPAFLAVAYSDRFQTRMNLWTTQLHYMLSSQAGKLFLAGCAIILIVTMFYSMKVVDDEVIDIRVYETLSGLQNKTFLKAESSKVVWIDLFPWTGVVKNKASREIERKNISLEFIMELSKLGPKAIFLNYSASVGEMINRKFVEELSRVPNLVMTLPLFDKAFPLDSVLQTTLHQVVQTTYTSGSPYGPKMHYILPAGERYVPNMSIELLRKYHSYPDDLRLQQSGHNMIFGDYTIPVDHNGRAYVRDDNRWNPMKIAAEKDSRDGLYKYGTRYGMAWNNFGPPRRLSSEEYREHIQGKIVIVNPVRDDAFILESVLQKKIITRMELENIWISILCIAIAAIIVYKLKPFYAFVANFVFGIAVIILCSLLYDEMCILVDIFYPLFTIVTAMLILPVIKLDNLGGIGETQ